MYSIPQFEDIVLPEYEEIEPVSSNPELQAFEEEFDDMRRAEIILHRYLRDTGENSEFERALKQFQGTLNAVKVAYATLAAENRYTSINSI